MKGYPKSKFEIVNQSQIQTIDVVTPVSPVPLVMATYTSDKGSEDWELITGLDDFIKNHGGLNFQRHGQAQLTVAEALRNGAYVLGKRLVDTSGKVANAGVRARVLNVDNVSYVYLYAESYNAPATADGKDKEAIFQVLGAVDPAASTIVPFTFDDAEVVEHEGQDAIPAQDAVIDEDTGEIITPAVPGRDAIPAYTSIDIPLFAVAASGSGESGLYFRLVPEYVASKANSYLKYTFETAENSGIIDTVVGSMNPDVVYDSVNQAIDNKVNDVSGNVVVKLYEEGVYRLAYELSKTATIGSTALSMEEIINMDMLNAMDRVGKNMIGNVITSGSEGDNWSSFIPTDISSKLVILAGEIGVPLANGSFGLLGYDPSKNSTMLTNLMLDAWGAATTRGAQFDPVIYDLDKYKVDLVIDAAFPMSVKNAIINVLDFRGDASFLADEGMNNLTTLDAVITGKEGDPLVANSTLLESKFVAPYHNYFDIISPYNNKRIKVTMPFLLISRILAHFRNGVGRPFAGMANQITFPEIIKGSLNFEPVVIPGEDQKQALVDKNINYVSSYDGLYVMETMYTNDNEYSQLSYLHNILLVQQVIKDLRTTCPKIRYTFIDGEDLDKYISDCEDVLEKYKTYFKSIKMTYMQDPKYEANKIFYATIEVVFKNFIQEEYFKVIALS